MSHFSEGQLRQVGNSLAAADWTAEDMTLMGQAGRDRLIGMRDSLRRGMDIVAAIVEGRTELWLAPGQDTGWVLGHTILTHLTETGLLAGCIDLAELEAIKAKGIDFYRKHFRGKAIFAWRGVRGDSVPCLIGCGGGVVLDWGWLGGDWSASSTSKTGKNFATGGGVLFVIFYIFVF